MTEGSSYGASATANNIAAFSRIERNESSSASRSASGMVTLAASRAVAGSS